MKRKRNYKGKLCKTCNVPVSIGSKLGFCRNHRPKLIMSKQAKKLIRLSKLGSKNPCFGKVPSVETRKKLSEALKGSKSPFWEGGKTAETRRLRNTLEYKLWREAVFKRDDYKCIICLKRGCELNADHIKPFALFPELRFAIDNGRTLCVPCHKETPTWGFKIYNDKFTRRTESNS